MTMSVCYTQISLILLMIPILHASPFGQEARDSFVQNARQDNYLNSQIDDPDGKPDFGNLAESLGKWSDWSNDDLATNDVMTENAEGAEWPEKRSGRSSFVGLRGRRDNFRDYSPFMFSRSYRRYRFPRRPSAMYVAIRGKRLDEDTQYDDLYRDLASAEMSEMAKRRLGFTAMRGR